MFLYFIFSEKVLKDYFSDLKKKYCILFVFFSEMATNVLLRVSFDQSGYIKISFFFLFKDNVLTSYIIQPDVPFLIIAATLCFPLLSFLWLGLHHKIYIRLQLLWLQPEFVKNTAYAEYSITFPSEMAFSLTWCLCGGRC